MNIASVNHYSPLMHSASNKNKKHPIRNALIVGSALLSLASPAKTTAEQKAVDTFKRSETPEKVTADLNKDFTRDPNGFDCKTQQRSSNGVWRTVNTVTKYARDLCVTHSDSVRNGRPNFRSVGKSKTTASSRVFKTW